VSVPEFAPGKVVGGKYTLGPLLQRTLWAATYRAQWSGQDVVVKVLDTGLAARQPVLDAILRAGAAAATVPEPFVVPILEHGKDPETGALFIVTRMSPNAPLSSLIARGPSPVEAVVAMMRSIGQAVDAAHAMRLAHLALKPSNVFVGPAPGPPGAFVAQIGDFGANAIRALAPDEARQSFAAPWLAPEQIANDDVAGPSSDVFAAALIAFAALTGTSFWRSCATPAPDPAAWRAEVIGAPPRASQRAAELGVTLSPTFDAVFARALTVPHSRFASVGELAKALSDALEASRAAGAPAQQGPAFAATVPLTGPLAAPGYPQTGGSPGAVPPGAAQPNEPVQAVAAGEPKKGGKGWIFAVVALVFVIGAGIGVVFFMRARANASVAMAAASASAAAAEASASAAAAMASAQAAVNAAEAPAASGEAPAASGAAPTASGEAPAASGEAPAASGGAPEPAAAGSGVAIAPQPSPPDTGGGAAPLPPPRPPPPSPDEPRPQPHRPANPPPAAGGENPRPAPTGAKKPCGKFLERCPDSGS
jgi:serine/threonine protein kinase